MRTNLDFRVIFRLIILIYLMLSNVIYSFSADCSKCDGIVPKTYKPTSSTTITNENNDWSTNGQAKANDMVRFDQVKNYVWDAGNKTTEILGIILEKDVKLSLKRSNPANQEAFDIEGGCIIVKSGAVLTLQYISTMKNVSICVEDGGKIKFDQDESISPQVRNTFTFEGVTITLETPNSKIEFGNANIVLKGSNNLLIGYVGNGCNGNSGNVTSTGGTTGLCDFIALPVEWNYLNSFFNSTERSTTINWATAKEWENSHFEIERSVNGISNWEKIGEVRGMGWTDNITEYSFCDEKLPIGGGNIYYRLKQVDFNLKFEYSKTVVVRVPPLTVTKGKWRVYPNPVNDVNFYIARTELEEISSISFKVLSSNDQMRSTVVANERELTEAVKKGFDKLPKGVFIVEIQWNQKVEYLKVLKN